MKLVKVTDLRKHLPEYLANVARGQRVRVTSRGRVIAELIPPSVSRKDAEAARARLHGTVLGYEKPTEPVIDQGDWDAATRDGNRRTQLRAALALTVRERLDEMPRSDPAPSDSRNRRERFRDYVRKKRRR